MRVHAKIAIINAQDRFHGTPLIDAKRENHDECRKVLEGELSKLRRQILGGELTGRIEEMERQKAASVAEEDYLTAAEIKRSITELVDQREALERAAEEEEEEEKALY
jgi:hypothetical protein